MLPTAGLQQAYAGMIFGVTAMPDCSLCKAELGANPTPKPRDLVYETIVGHLVACKLVNCLQFCGRGPELATSAMGFTTTTTSMNIDSKRKCKM